MSWAIGLLAVIRPDDWNLPLFVHVLGAMVLVGATLASASMLTLARGDAGLVRLGHRTLLIVGLPSYAAMWGGGHWIYATQGLDERPIEFAWETIGFAVAEVGAVLFVAALVVGGIAARRVSEGRGAGLVKATQVICLILLGGLVVAAWAMAAKPD